MTMNRFSLVVMSFLLTLAACKKSVSPNNSAVGGGNQQISYSTQRLAVSTVLKVASPLVELYPDTVYTSYPSASPLFKPLPAGFNDRIVSFYLPAGYMLIVAENQDGTGESACYVATDAPIRANLPLRLRSNISYLRYTKINNPDKKGTCNVNDAAVTALSSKWYYSWGLTKPSYTGQQYVPMTWGKNACTDANVEYLVGRNDVDHLLSFNEPDNASQSNVPVDTAVARYRIMQKTGLRLGTPVTTQDQAFGNGRWLTNFMAQAQTQKLRTDYVAVHWYDWGNQTNNAATDSLTAELVFSRFVTYLDRVRQAYPNHTIWVTEYNANVARTSEVVNRRFMKLSSEYMNSLPYVERYSYFFESSFPPVNPDGSLTTLGAYWKSLPSPKSLSGNITGDAILLY